MLEKLKKELLHLTYIHGYQRGPFLLSSGRRSNYYINGKMVTMSREGIYRTARYILASLTQKRYPVEAVGGLTLGADPIAAAVAALSQVETENPLSCFIVRKEAKAHGTRSRIEGPFAPGLKTIIVDDVLTSGASVLAAAQAVEAAGGTVSAVYVLVDRMEGGREELERHGYPLEAVMNRRELEALQEEMQQRYPGLFASLQKSPVGWKEVPWSEIAPSHPGLFRRLEQLSQALAAREESREMEEAASQEAARSALELVKAAELHPDGEEALESLWQRTRARFGL